MLKSLILSIFGSYEPVSQEVVTRLVVYNTSTAVDANGQLVTTSTGSIQSFTDDVIVSGLSGLDWPYILGVVGFFIVLYCILRIIGSVINHV